MCSTYCGGFNDHYLGLRIGAPEFTALTQFCGINVCARLTSNFKMYLTDYKWEEIGTIHSCKLSQASCKLVPTLSLPGSTKKCPTAYVCIPPDNMKHLLYTWCYAKSYNTRQQISTGDQNTAKFSYVLSIWILAPQQTECVEGSSGGRTYPEKIGRT